MQNIETTINWGVNNLGNLAALVAALIASAGATVKALEAIVKLLTTIFPALKGADGKLQGAAAWLDAASKSKLLNAMALSPAVAFHASLNPPGVDTTEAAHAAIRAPAPTKGYSTTGTLGLLALLTLLSMLSCATVGKVAISCSEQAIEQNLPSITTEVTTILGGNSPTWQDSMDALYSTAGDAVLCAVEALVSQLTSGSMSLDPRSQLMLVRAQVYLAAQPKKIAP